MIDYTNIEARVNALMEMEQIENRAPPDEAQALLTVADCIAVWRPEKRNRGQARKAHWLVFRMSAPHRHTHVRYGADLRVWQKKVSWLVDRLSRLPDSFLGGPPRSP